VEASERQINGGGESGGAAILRSVRILFPIESHARSFLMEFS
jgi:hypothetical protein